MNDDEYGGGKSGADEGDDGAGNVDDESMTVIIVFNGDGEGDDGAGIWPRRGVSSL